MIDTHLICYFPNITEPVTSGNIALPEKFSYGFHMDNVTNLLNLTDNLGTVEVQDNPKFLTFTEKVKSHLYTNEYLTINVSLFFLSSPSLALHLLSPLSLSFIKVALSFVVMKLGFQS